MVEHKFCSSCGEKLKDSKFPLCPSCYKSSKVLVISVANMVIMLVIVLLEFME